MKKREPGIYTPSVQMKIREDLNCKLGKIKRVGSPGFFGGVCAGCYRASNTDFTHTCAVPGSPFSPFAGGNPKDNWQKWTKLIRKLQSDPQALIASV